MECGDKFCLKGKIWTVKQCRRDSFYIVDQEGNFDDVYKRNLDVDPTFKPYIPDRDKKEILHSIDKSLLEILKILKNQFDSKI